MQRSFKRNRAANASIKIRKKQPSGKEICRPVALIAPCNDGGNIGVVQAYAEKPCSPLCRTFTVADFSSVHVFNRKAYFGSLLRNNDEIFKTLINVYRSFL